jgi:hypothetical protein
VIGAYERMRSYDSITGVAQDFTTTSPEYLAADMRFAQAPSPQNVFIGRWFSGDGLTAGGKHASDQVL